jgi:hypothetical protein
MKCITKRATGRPGMEGEGRKMGTNIKRINIEGKIIMKEIKKGTNKYTTEQRRIKDRMKEWTERK